MTVVISVIVAVYQMIPRNYSAVDNEEKVTASMLYSYTNESDFHDKVIIQARKTYYEEQKNKRIEYLNNKVSNISGIKFDEDGKMVVNSAFDARRIDIRVPSNWTESDFEGILNKEIKKLIPVVVRMERKIGVNALYLMAVAVNETGWGRKMSGRYNFFNWSNDGRVFHSFQTLNCFEEFSTRVYKRSYLDKRFFASRLGRLPEKITIDVVNVRYALNSDGSVNTQWANTVSDVMKTLSRRRINQEK